MKKAFAVIVLALAFGSSASAQFGGIVYDPTNYGNAVLRFKQLISGNLTATQKLLIAIQTLNQMRTEYEAWQIEMRSLSNMGRYGGSFPAWQNLLLMADMYGRATPVQNAANTGVGAPGAYQNASIPVTPDAAYGSATPDWQTRIADRYATINLADGSNAAALTEIGSTRANLQQLQAQIANLQQDSLSADPSVSNEKAILQKTNAATLLGAQVGLDQQKIQLQTLENLLIQSKERRDRMMNALGTESTFYQNESANTSAGIGGFAGAVSSSTMP
jgi:hypothetical protein